MMKKRHHIEKSYMTICKGKLTKQQELVGYVKKIDNEDRVRFVKKDDYLIQIVVSFVYLKQNHHIYDHL